MTTAPHTDHPLRHFDNTCPACLKDESVQTITSTPGTYDRADAVNLANNVRTDCTLTVTAHGIETLARAVLEMDKQRELTEKAEAELARYARIQCEAGTTLGDQLDEAEKRMALEAELATLRADAERYRWLRCDKGTTVRLGVTLIVNIEDGDWIYGPELDELTDAAITGVRP